MTSRKGVPTMDMLPEHFPYRDNGCDVSPSCLRCPLPRCKYDPDDNGTRNWFQRERKARRDRQVLRVRRNEGVTAVALAHRFHISERTVHRILAGSQIGHSSALSPTRPPIEPQVER